jgi:DNA-binding response OmpR family regulator
VADTRILLIGSIDSDVLIKILGRPGRSLARIEDLEKLGTVGIDHDVIVVESVAPPKTVADVCRELRAIPELAEVPVLAVGATDEVEERIRLLEAGADDVMVRPIDDRELDARVEALDLRHRRSKELRPSTIVSPTRRPGRRLIAVYSPKGSRSPPTSRSASRWST